MEIFLLLLDDLDDLFHALRMALPKIAGFGIALGLFAIVVISAMTWPWMLVSAAAFAALALGIRSSVRTLRSIRFPLLKTDP